MPAVGVGLKRPCASPLDPTTIMWTSLDYLPEDAIHGKERPVSLAKNVLGQSVVLDPQTFNWLQMQE